ncbi:hypothetical protein MRX96_054317 [Rhipicephalus microplus]
MQHRGSKRIGLITIVLDPPGSVAANNSAWAPAGVLCPEGREDPAGGPGTGAGGPLHHGFPLPATFPWAATARGKPRRGMMRRAVFSDAQRQGLEKRFQIQKYISKPDRKKLAEKLGLKDSQVSFASVRERDCMGMQRLALYGVIDTADGSANFY